MNALIDLQLERRRRLRAEHSGQVVSSPSLGELMGELAALAAYRALRTHERRHHRGRCLPRRRRPAR